MKTSSTTGERPTSPLPGRIGSQLPIDLFSWLVAVPFATLLRYEFNALSASWLPVVTLAFLMAASQFVIGQVLSLYRGRFTLGSFEEVRAVVLSGVIGAVIFGLIVLGVGPYLSIPRSVVFIAFPIALIIMLGTRYVKRLLMERNQRPDGATPVIIYGAGYLGESLARRMVTDPASPYIPVAFLDDAISASNRHIRDIPVFGGLPDLATVSEKTGASTLIVAISQADAALLRKVDATANPLGVDVLVTPALDHMLQGRASLTELRSIRIEDLISRQPIDTHMESIAKYLTGKRVLVTGAGGSIGSELCRQVTRFGPSELMMLDRDETGLQETQISIDGNGLLHTKKVILADIRSEERLREIFQGRSPEVVFHAAALKHLPLLEQYPDEAWDTNILGTLNVLQAARASGVETFVNVSTDKAADPTSVLGHSKRVAEKLTAWMAHEEEGRARYVSVRFGNVIGSRGSMLPTFTRLIEQGGPVTVTHPDVTRYFMTIPEACQLVIQAGGIGRPGEVLILDMGEPVRILDIAQRMIELSGKNVEIIFTGLREGEKLHEDLIGESEADERPFHELITHAHVGSISPERLDKAGWTARLHNDVPATPQEDTVDAQ